MSKDSKCDLKVSPSGLNDRLYYGVWGEGKKNWRMMPRFLVTIRANDNQSNKVEMHGSIWM